MIDYGLFEAREKWLTLLKHDVDLVCEVIVLDSCFCMRVYLEVTVSNCHSSTSILNNSGAANDVNLSQLLLFQDASQVDLVQNLSSYLFANLSVVCILLATSEHVDLTD